MSTHTHRKQYLRNYLSRIIIS